MASRRNSGQALTTSFERKQGNNSTKKNATKAEFRSRNGAASSAFSLAELENAAAVVHRYMSPTPQYCWPLLSQLLGCEVWVKHENHTPIGAFKIRGGI